MPVKSGWLYEKRIGLVIIGKKWEPRWVVIYGEPVPALGTYEQRSDAQPPYAPLKHIDLVPTTIVHGKDKKKSAAQSLLGWIKKRGVHAETDKDDGQSIISGFADLSLQGTGATTDSIFWISNESGIKLCFGAKSMKERNEWITAIQGIISTSVEVRKQSLSAEPPMNMKSVPASLSHSISYFDADAITHYGVVIMDGKTVARIKSGNYPSNPLATLSSNGSIDSIVGAMKSSEELLADPHGECTISAFI